MLCRGTMRYLAHRPAAVLDAGRRPASCNPHLKFALLDELPGVAYLFLPLLGGALLVGLCTRYNWAGVLAWPVDRGVMLSGRRLFGDNKTFRGVLAGTLGTALGMVLQGKLLHAFAPTRSLEYVDYSRLRLWRVGLLLGLTRMLSELPNSCAKRQLHIPPGQLAQGRWAAVFYVLDHLDYLPGTWIVLSGLVRVTVNRVLVSIGVVFVAHHLASAAGYWLGMRRSIH
jgi:CDP-archaeol synthase